MSVLDCDLAVVYSEYIVHDCICSRCVFFLLFVCFFFCFQAEDGIRDLVRSRGLGDVYKRQRSGAPCAPGLLQQAMPETHRAAARAEPARRAP